MTTLSRRSPGTSCPTASPPSPPAGRRSWPAPRDRPRSSNRGSRRAAPACSRSRGSDEMSSVSAIVPLTTPSAEFFMHQVHVRDQLLRRAHLGNRMAVELVLGQRFDASHGDPVQLANVIPHRVQRRLVHGVVAPGRRVTGCPRPALTAVSAERAGPRNSIAVLFRDSGEPAPRPHSLRTAGPVRTRPARGRRPAPYARMRCAAADWRRRPGARPVLARRRDMSLPRATQRGASAPHPSRQRRNGG